MKTCIYAGSFDPWTLGHQFVLNAALEVFDCAHIVCAFNPAKQSILDPQVRARVIAHSIDPFSDWWSLDPPFRIGKRVVVTSQEGLVANYARENNIGHLIRGLRSTTDFEAEFNLYFSNHAINEDLQTWTIMCPPSLLYCSSTYVKTVVGKQNIKFVGTKFMAQALMLNRNPLIGRIFDLIESCSVYRFKSDSFNLNLTDLSGCLQLFFTELSNRIFHISASSQKKITKHLNLFLKQNKEKIYEILGKEKAFPKNEVNTLWAILCYSLEENFVFPKGIHSKAAFLLSLTQNLGKTSMKLFNEKEVIKACEVLGESDARK